MRNGYLKKDQMERRTSQRVQWVVAWRVVDDDGDDIFQPWARTMGEAIDIAERMGIHVVKLKVEVKGFRTYLKLAGDYRVKSESGVFNDLKLELRHQGYDCIKKRPEKDGHMTSAPFYIRAKDSKWAIIDPNHEIYDCAEQINLGKELVFHNHWAVPEPQKAPPSLNF